jgi:hypothetical protein
MTLRPAGSEDWRTKCWFAASPRREMPGLRVVDLNQAQECSGSVDVLNIQLVFVSGCGLGDKGRGTGIGLGSDLAGTGGSASCQGDDGQE